MAGNARNRTLCFHLFFIILTCYISTSHGCIIADGQYDLTPLSRFVWSVFARQGTHSTEYKIQLCAPLNTSDACSGGAVCRLEEGVGSSIGNHVPKPKAYKGENVSGFWLEFDGDVCDQAEKFRTYLYFQCDKHLGSPIFVTSNECSTYFLWKSLVACNIPSVRKEIPCHAHDSQGNKYDLSGLMKDFGGHLVSAGTSFVDFYINVCTDILPDDDTTNCPHGASACRVMGGEALGFGTVSNALELLENGDLRIKYHNNVTFFPAGCSRTPETTITFVCPKDGRERSPIILSDNNCDYKIEWATVFACPVKHLESADGCHLSSSIDGIDEDLSLLKIDTGIPHHAVGKIDGKSYTFYFSICGLFSGGFSCSNSSAVACRKSIDDPLGVTLGTLQTLRYSDAQLYLMYESGDCCQRNGSRCYTSFSSVIFLKCGTDVGAPQFLQDKDCVSFFEWETKHACVERMLGSMCSVKNGGRVIDLSLLTRGQGVTSWVAVAGSFGPLHGSRVYINVCSPVGRVGLSASCPHGAAVCVEGSGGKMLDFGHYVQQPELDPQTGDVFLNYTSFKNCKFNSQKKAMSVIRFVCRPGEFLLGLSHAGPRIIRQSLDGCLLEFEWSTAAACAQMELNGTQCKIMDPIGDFSIDLSPLKSNNSYNVTTDSDVYYLNVCGGVTVGLCAAIGGDVAACRVNRTNPQDVQKLGISTDVITYYNGYVNLTYVNGSLYKANNQKTLHATIIFICDDEVGMGGPEFVSVDMHVYNFKWRTFYACPPRPVKCQFLNEANNNLYDLSSLMRRMSNQNWEIKESMPAVLNRKFYLNVCRSLTKVDIVSRKFCDDDAAICGTRLIDGQEVAFIRSIGKAEMAPRFEDGQLTLRYTSGSVCPESSSGLNYSAVIYFHCADYSVPSEEGPGPIFLRNKSCEYTFLWSNQAACPLQSSVATHSCSVTDPITGYSFSFTSLQGVFNIPATNSDVFKFFYLSFCGKINSSACGLSEYDGNETHYVSACGQLRSNDNMAVLADSSSRQLRISDSDAVMMEFDNSQQAGTPDFKIEISFLCHRQLNASVPKFVRQDGNLLVFEYVSALTCPPERVECKVRDGRGNSYDLTSLSDGPGHYEVRDPRPANRNILYHLNVCRPVLTAPFSNCPEDPIGACMSDSDSGIGYSLGFVQGKPYFDANEQTVTLKYLSGSSCNDGVHHRSTRMDFKCSSQMGSPQFVAETSDCEYIFSWETPAACPVRRVLGSNCRVLDSRYGIQFDLSDLARPNGYSVLGPNVTFLLNVCSAIRSDCNGQPHVGVCVTSDVAETSGGFYSDQLEYEQGELTLRYVGDEISSLFSFICDHSTTGEKGPSYLPSVSDNDTLVFIWKTSYACRSYKESTCKAFGLNNSVYDLSRLTLTDANYEFISKDGTIKYLMNVCRSVVHTKDAMCHYGAAVCGINITEVHIEKRYHNLGEVSNGPVIEDGVLTLVYEMGEVCQQRHGSSSHKKTIMRFSCNPDIGDGKPFLLAEDGCTYEFVWASAVACPVIQEDAEFNDCTVVNPNTDYRFDLNSLQSMSYFVNTTDEHVLSIAVCEAVINSSCGAGVGSCLQSNNASSNIGIANAKLQYHSGRLVLNYTNGEKCPKNSGFKSTVIYFSCDPTSKGSPVLVDKSDCIYSLSWATHFACEQQVHCSVEADGEVFDLSLLSRRRGYFAFSGENDDFKYILNVCKPLTAISDSPCPLHAAACRIDVDSKTTHSLGIAVGSPFLDRNGHVVLEYVNGSRCPQDHSRNASTRIVFVCDDSYVHNVLRLVDVTPECTFVFEWPTDVVCPTVSHGQISSNCSYFDARSKSSIDLARLKLLSPTGYKVKSDEVQGEFIISFCGTVEESGPCSLAAVCLDVGGTKSSWGATATSLYDYDGQVLRVSYRNGDDCVESATGKKTSVIWFECDKTAGPGFPELSKTFDCQVVFHWRTSLMCPEATPDCTFVHQGQLFDFRLLASYSHSWTVVDEATQDKFWLNVCARSVKEKTVPCPSGSAICWMSQSGAVVSIGSYETQNLTTSADGNSLLLSYTKHVPDLSQDCLSVIEFVCSMKASNPQFISRNVNGCLFKFRWETPVACPEKRQFEVLEVDGKIIDRNFDLVVDLSSLITSVTSVEEHRDTDDYIYNINLSGLSFFPQENVCHGAAICQTKKGDSSFQRNLGFAKDRKLYLQGAEVLVVINSGSICDRNAEKNVTSTITFRCSPSANIGNPSFVYESVDCSYAFDWESSAMCYMDVIQWHSSDNGKETKSSGTGLAIGIMMLVICVVIVLLGILYLKRNQRFCISLSRHPLSTISGLCHSNRQSRGSVSFSRLSEEEANINC